MTTQMAPVCPKCGGRMRTYDRSSIVVEQCEDCRGIFLDGGELERLIDVEGGGWSGRVIPPADDGDREQRDRIQARPAHARPRSSRRVGSRDDDTN